MIVGPVGFPAIEIYSVLSVLLSGVKSAVPSVEFFVLFITIPDELFVESLNPSSSLSLKVTVEALVILFTVVAIFAHKSA